MASTGTPATVALARAGIDFELHTYATEQLSHEEGSYGEAVAALLGVAPERLFKTLVAEVDGRLVVAVVPVAGSLSLKALAAAAGGKKARMADPAAAQRSTGYLTGGISPFGQKRRLPTYVDASLAALQAIFVSGGRRGLQLELDPADLVTALSATAVAGLSVLKR